MIPALAVIACLWGATLPSHPPRHAIAHKTTEPAPVLGPELMPAWWASVSTAPDSVTYTWTLPIFGALPRSSAPDSTRLLHSWMTSEVWRLDQFFPFWPPVWAPYRIATLPEAAPGAARSVRVASRYGTAWVIAIGPAGPSLPSNLQPGRVTP